MNFDSHVCVVDFESFKLRDYAFVVSDYAPVLPVQISDGFA